MPASLGSAPVIERVPLAWQRGYWQDPSDQRNRATAFRAAYSTAHDAPVQPFVPLGSLGSAIHAFPARRQSHVETWVFPVIRDEPKLYVRTADSGNQTTRAFCPDCGTMLFLRVSARPDLVAIRVGTLDDPSGFRPEADIRARSPGIT
jgi:hypothetical protein